MFVAQRIHVSSAPAEETSISVAQKKEASETNPTSTNHTCTAQKVMFFT
jgi:hypothetical protein